MGDLVVEFSPDQQVPEMPNAALSLIIVAFVIIAAVMIIVQKSRRAGFDSFYGR